MFSEFFKRLLEFTLKFTALMGMNYLTPIRRGHGAVIIVIRKWNFIRYLVGLGLITGASLLFLFRTIQSYFENNPVFPICYIFTLIVTLLNISTMILALNLHPLKALASQMINYALQFEGKWITRYNYKKSAIGLKLDVFFVVICVWFIVLLPAGLVAFLIMFDDLPILPHNMFPSILNSQSSYSRYIVVFTFYSYICCAFSATALFHCAMLITYFATIVPCLHKEFKGGLKPEAYSTTSELRRPFNLTREYLCIEILHKQAMCIFGVITIIGQALTVQFVLYCNYTLLRDWDNLELFMKCFIAIFAFDMTVFWSLTLEIGGRFYLSSTRLLKSWKSLKLRNKGEARFMSKFKRRCRPLAIGLEGYSKMKRISVLKFISSLVKTTVRALLALEP